MIMNAQGPIVLYCGPEQALDVVTSVLRAPFVVRHVGPDPNCFFSEFRHCHAYLDASMKVPLSAQDIANAESLRLVVTATTGATHIDKSALDKMGIPLMTLKGQTEVLKELTPAAELTWCLILSCARQLRGAMLHVSNAEWERTKFPGMMLKGKTIGIIGIGRIGGWIAQYANSFGMTVKYYDPYIEDTPAFCVSVGLEELVSTSDIVTVHVHVTEQTKGMINNSLLANFKHGSVFVNTSRSELTDEQAIVKALESGKLSAVGVDVVWGEPNIRESPLWQYSQNHNNVVITPHIGGYSPEAVNHVVRYSAQRIKDYFQSK